MSWSKEGKEFLDELERQLLNPKPGKLIRIKKATWLTRNITMSEENNVEEVTTEAPIADGHIRVQASAAYNDEKKTAYFDFDFGDTAAEAIEKFGDACVHERFIRAAKIEAQARIREMITIGKSPDEISAYMESSWYPGASSQNPEVAILGKFQEMSPEERQELIRKLEAQVG